MLDYFFFPELLLTFPPLPHLTSLPPPYVRAAGVPIWAITPQNEPEFPAPWEACAFDENYELEFINKYLGPTLEQNHPDVLILAFDHNKDHLLSWAETVMGGDTGPNGGYVDGMAFHWYTGQLAFWGFLYGLLDRLLDRN